MIDRIAAMARLFAVMLACVAVQFVPQPLGLFLSVLLILVTIPGTLNRNRIDSSPMLGTPDSRKE